MSTKEQLQKLIEQLSPDKQRAALDYIQKLNVPKLNGMPFSKLIPFAGSLSSATADAMEKAIEEGCERIDPHGWQLPS